MPADQPVNIAELIPKIAAQTLVFAALLFLPAWTLLWWQGWTYLLLSLIVGIAGLLWERMKSLSQPVQPVADKRATLISAGLGLLWFVFIPLDVFHLRLLPLPPTWLRWTGLALWAVSIWLIYLTFRANSFAATVVRLQQERQQTVIDSGPYAIVHHPLYSAALIYAIGIALWLGSIAEIALIVLPLAGLVARIKVEEAHLSHYLPG